MILNLNNFIHVQQLLLLLKLIIKQMNFLHLVMMIQLINLLHIIFNCIKNLITKNLQLVHFYINHLIFIYYIKTFMDLYFFIMFHK